MLVTAQVQSPTNGSASPAFIAKVNRMRVNRGFADSVETTEEIIKAAKRMPEARKSRTAFLRWILGNTLRITHHSRHEDIDVLAMGYMEDKRMVRFLDVGCSFSSSEKCAPTIVDTVRNFGKCGIEVEAWGMDKEIPPEMDGKTSKGATYVKHDLFGEGADAFGKFDFIRSMHTLYYYNDARKARAIGILGKMLLPGGILIEDSMNTNRICVRAHKLGWDGKVSVIFQGNPYDSHD